MVKKLLGREARPRELGRERLGAADHAPHVQNTGPVGDADRDRIRSGHNRERLGHGLQRCIDPVLARSTPSGVRESLERLLGDAFHFP